MYFITFYEYFHNKNSIQLNCLNFIISPNNLYEFPVKFPKHISVQTEPKANF